MAKFPTIEEMAQQVKERVLEECLIDGEPLGELIDSGDLVHVIRCKDCKFSSPNGVYGCSINSFAYDLDKRLYSNDFCSLAERKEECEK